MPETGVDIEQTIGGRIPELTPSPIAAALPIGASLCLQKPGNRCAD